MMCVRCKTEFYERTMSEPAELCDCGACISLADWRREHRADREPSTDDLEQRRSERLSPFYPHGGLSTGTRR